MLVKAVYEFKLPQGYPEGDTSDISLIDNDIQTIGKGIYLEQDIIFIDNNDLDTDIGVFLAKELSQYIQYDKDSFLDRIRKVRSCIVNRNYTIEVKDVIIITLDLKGKE